MYIQYILLKGLANNIVFFCLSLFSRFNPEHPGLFSDLDNLNFHVSIIIFFLSWTVMKRCLQHQGILFFMQRISSTCVHSLPAHSEGCPGLNDIASDRAAIVSARAP